MLRARLEMLLLWLRLLLVLRLLRLLLVLRLLIARIEWLRLARRKRLAAHGRLLVLLVIE